MLQLNREERVEATLEGEGLAGRRGGVLFVKKTEAGHAKGGELGFKGHQPMIWGKRKKLGVPPSKSRSSEKKKKVRYKIGGGDQ